MQDRNFLMKQGKRRKSMPKHWFFHRQFNTEWVVLADNSKNKTTKRTEDDIPEDKLFYAFYFSINAFLSTAYSQVTSTDTCKNTPISIQILKTTVNFRREKRKGLSSCERRMCLSNLTWSSSALCAHRDIWQAEQSKDLAHTLINPALCTYVPAIQYPFSPVPPDPLQQFLEGHRKLRCLWQALYSPSLYTQTDRLWRWKSSFSPWPLPKKSLSGKMLLSKKFHFNYSSRNYTTSTSRVTKGAKIARWAHANI